MVTNIQNDLFLKNDEDLTDIGTYWQFEKIVIHGFFLGNYPQKFELICFKTELVTTIFNLVVLNFFTFLNFLDIQQAEVYSYKLYKNHIIFHTKTRLFV
jgi:hypothetical protein